MKSKEQIQERDLKIKNLYLEGNSIKEIEKLIELSKSTISRALRRLNVVLRKDNRHLDPLIIDEISSLYKDNFLIKDIAFKLGMDKNRIARILKTSGIITTRGMKRIFNFNDNYFENIDNQNKAYFLGLLTADGCNSVRYIRLGLQDRDIDILNKFKNEIGFTGNVHIVIRKEKNRKKVALIRLYSKKMCDDLCKYGIIPAKTNSTYFPEIPEEFYRHFIRGLFDGDGCIYTGEQNARKKYTFIITGNNTLIYKVQEVLIKECNISKTKLPRANDSPENTISIFTQGKKDVLSIREWIYKDAEMYLERKKEKFYSII